MFFFQAEDGIRGAQESRGLGDVYKRQKYDPLEFAYIESFRANPGKVWKMLVELDEILLRAKPNGAHLSLAELEKRGILRAIVTQNVDSLHQRAAVSYTHLTLPKNYSV